MNHSEITGVGEDIYSIVVSGSEEIGGEAKKPEQKSSTPTCTPVKLMLITVIAKDERYAVDM